MSASRGETDAVPNAWTLQGSGSSNSSTESMSRRVRRDFKAASGVLTSFYYALPSRIYRRFSRQSKLTSDLVQARNSLLPLLRAELAYGNE
jgi:hypothetical protein